MKVDVYVRTAEPGDTNFIFNSWLRSYEKVMKSVPKQMYRRGQMDLMKQLVGRSTVYVACDEKDLSQIYGYLIAEKLVDIDILHYIYVKSPFRRFGIGRVLYDVIDRNAAYPCIASHKTLYFDYLKEKWNLSFNPYILLKKEMT